jgi:hypothetical protein
MTLTPFRRRALSLLEQRGALDMQEIAYLLVDGSTSKGFRHPASATRFGGGVLAPLIRGGFATPNGARNGYRRVYQITPAGRALLRSPTP